MIWVEETTVTAVAGTEPTVTVAPAAKLNPVMVIDVPPAIGPLLGLTDVTAGVVTNLSRSARVVALVPTDVVT